MVVSFRSTSLASQRQHWVHSGLIPFHFPSWPWLLHLYWGNSSPVPFKSYMYPFRVLGHGMAWILSRQPSIINGESEHVRFVSIVEWYKINKEIWSTLWNLISLHIYMHYRHFLVILNTQSQPEYTITTIGNHSIRTYPILEINSMLLNAYYTL